MNVDFDFKDNRLNYPTKIEELRRAKFIEICSVILYSDDERRIQNAYNLIFTEYRQSIIRGDFSISISLFEDVILKILNDADNNLYERYGIQNNPFLRFVALIKEQEERFNTLKKSVTNMGRSVRRSRMILKNYLLMFIDGHKDKIKNNYIRRLIHVYFASI